MTAADDQQGFEFDCPLCAGAFEADPQMLGQEVECPHCGEVVELPRPEELDEIDHRESGAASVSPATPFEQPQAAAAQDKPAPEPRRPMTPAERDAARRRLNRTLAIAGAVILIVVFLLLSRLG